MKYIKLFNSVKIIKGYNRTLIFDSTREAVRFIPNDLFNLLYQKHGFNIVEKTKGISSNNKIIINEYLVFLITNNFGFYCNSLSEFENFEYCGENFELPFDLSYLIIDLSNENNFDLNIIEQIIDCKITYLQIRFCEDISISELKFVLKQCELLNDSFVQEISFVFKFNIDLYFFIKNKTIFINKFLNFTFHSCDNNNVETFSNLTFNFIVDRLIIPISCGNIRKSNFVYNDFFYLESKQNNTCLNRKISIDKDGNIKNCPSMNRVFGNIKHTTLKNVLKIPDFNFFWNISKDQIDVCKDCEFRHICTDCRAYLEKPEDNYSKPLKCGYDPYTNTWGDWSVNPLKKIASEFYGLENLV